MYETFLDMREEVKNTDDGGGGVNTSIEEVKKG
jgi:hypothetical protein